MGDPLLFQLATGVAGNAAFAAIAHTTRQLVREADREFAKRLAQYAARHGHADLDRKALQRVTLAPDAWVALLRRDPAPSTWPVLLFDLLQPGHETDPERLAAVLSDGIEALAAREIYVAIRTFQDARDLHDGQTRLHAEQVRVRDLLNAVLARLSGTPDTDSVAPSISNCLAATNHTISTLTEEQFFVIRALRGQRRALVSGTAGSGKTVVACEKALRLDRAGIRTLFVCHSPILAQQLGRMLEGSDVVVRTFGGLVARLLGGSSVAAGHWTQFDAPSLEDLDAAFDAAVAMKDRWEAVIVDEAQDFEDDWWILLEAMMDGNASILYAFSDDDQALKSRPQSYPAIDATFHLSKNCRNAGRVYTAMRSLEDALPRSEEQLRNLGVTNLVLTPYPKLVDTLKPAVRRLPLELAEASIALLSGDADLPELLARTSSLEVGLPWRDNAIATALSLTKAAHSLLGIQKYTAHLSSKAENALSNLSYEISPTPADVLILKYVADSIAYVHHRFSPKEAKELQARALESDHEVVLAPLSEDATALQFAELSIAVSARSWIAPPAREAARPVARCPDPGELVNGTIGAYSIAEFKGLEADVVLVVWDPDHSPARLTELYVAVSRARFAVSMVMPAERERVLPRQFLDSMSVYVTRECAECGALWLVSLAAGHRETSCGWCASPAAGG